MITLQTYGDSSVKFVFENSSHYLYGNGEIIVPLNSLILVEDSSDMITFKKIDGDVFVSATVAEFGMSKSDIEDWYKTNMVGSTGGGGGTTPEEVQEMIDESISGKADTTAVTAAISSATDDMATQTWVGQQGYITGVDLSDYATLEDIPDVSNYFDGAEYDSGTTRINFYHGNTVKAYIDASAFIVDGMIDNVSIETISGASYLVIDFNTASGKEDIQIPLTDIFDPSNYYTKNEVDGAISAATSGKADTTAVTASINAAVSGKVDTSTFETYSGSVETALSGKQDTLSAGTNITISGNVISAEGGGGKAIEAGRGISVTTGETADTVSFNLPISAGTGINALIIASDTIDLSNKARGSYSVSLNGGGAHANYATGDRSIAEGADTKAYGECCHTEGHSTSAGTTSFPFTSYAHAEGDHTYAAGHCSHSEGNYTKASGNSSHAEGYYAIANNEAEHASGKYNVSNKANGTWGDSGNTLFSVGNGTADNARHNAFEIRQNGDIYITSGNTDIKLQDNLGGGGKAIEAGRGISITTGETADTVSFNLSISAGTGTASIQEGNSTKASGQYSHAEGNGTQATGNCAHSEGYWARAYASYSHAEGYSTTANGSYSHAEGYTTKTTNDVEHASGKFNVSNKVNNIFGGSGNTLFSVGNGTGDNARHNAFEIRQNGDIYISKDGSDIKLQDALGGGITSGEVQTMIAASISGKTDESAFTSFSGSVDARFAEDEEVTAAALNALNASLSGKLDTSAYTQVVTTSAVTSGSTAVIESGAVYNALGGLKLQKISQSDYDALVQGGTVDANTLYIITNVVS